MNIPFVNLSAQYQAYKKDIDDAMARIIQNNAFILGPEVSSLEKNLSEATGAKYTISCSSGTDALTLALKGLGLKSGDEIITTPFTFFATIGSILNEGCVPVFADIEPETYNIDISKIEAQITPKTKAIMPVSLYGQMPDLSAIMNIAKKHNLFVIEDAAQSFGASQNGKNSCNVTHVSATSFFPAKPLGCFGDGGAVFTNDSSLADKIRLIMNHGQKERYVHVIVGQNSRMDALQAAVLNAKLKYYGEEKLKRDKIAQIYNSKITNPKLIKPKVLKGNFSAWAQYSLRTKNRDAFIDYLKTKNIPSAVHYPQPAYAQQCMSGSKTDPKNYPITNEVCMEIVSLPICAFLQTDHQEYIIQVVNDWK